MNYLISCILLLRPINLLLSIVSIFISAYLIESLDSPKLIYVIIVVLSFMGASNILNDLLDIKIDKINQPNRMLVSKKVGIRSAIIIMVFLYLIGILSSILIDNLGMKIALLIVLPLLILYNFYLKQLPLIGNIIIGLNIGLVFIFTECSINGTVDKMWMPFALATSLSIIRELIKDAADIKGDSNQKFNTFPIKYGLYRTNIVIKIFSLLLCTFALLPIFWKIYNYIYFYLLIFFVLIPLLWLTFSKLQVNSNIENYKYASHFIKFITLFGILVILSTGL